MAGTSLDAFKAKDTRFVTGWLKSKGLHKLCSEFKGIQEPFQGSKPGGGGLPYETDGDARRLA